jgi:hypothetical protein
MPFGARFECLTSEVGRKHRYILKDSLMLFYGRSGVTVKRVGRIKGNVDSGNTKFKFHFI